MTKKLKMKNWTWQQIFDFQKEHNNPGFEYELDSMPKKYRPAFAAALSVAKWSPDNPRRGGGDCGLCTLYDYNHDCSTCPLKKLGGDCNEDDSLYDLARFGDKKAKDKLYVALLKIYAEAWEKI